MYSFKPRRTASAFALLLAVLAGLWLAGNWPGLVARLARVAVLTQGEVHTEAAVQGTLIAAQKVVVAPASGRITWLAPAGVRVRFGQALARITTPGGREFVLSAPAAGLLSHTTDGMETVLRPADLARIKMPPPGMAKAQTVAGGSLVQAGRAVGRITDNLDPVYVYMPAAGLPPGMLKKGRTWSLAWRGRALTGKVAAPAAGGVYLELSLYPEGLLAGRLVDLDVVTRVLNGFLVPQDALADRGGRTGIYLVVGGRARWTAVNVTGYLKGLAAVEPPKGALLYVATPRLVRDGVVVR